ncbi:MAG TPA: LysM peptidoglycan-binding domain-containing protein [Chloroflexi bacterium]|nr:LysM peptidoglycan-binding domain-containing protein [Chloroflexota bacterium]
MGFRVQFDLSSFNRRYLFILIGGGLVLLVVIVALILLLPGRQEEQPPLAESATATPTPSPLPVPSPAGPPTETPTPAPTPTLEPYEHVVQSGETLYYIIQLYGYRDLNVVPEVLLLNGMANENDLIAGQTLLIPRQTPTPGPTPSPTPTGGPESVATQAAGADETTPDYSGCDPENRCVSPDGQYWVHIVRPGDTIAGIAFAYTARISSIKNANGLLGDNPLIFEGQQLLIPIEVTLTPTLTPTGGPDSTATPTPTLSPPTLLAPRHQAVIPRGEAVVLQWVANQRLRDGDYYLITLRNLATGEEHRETTRSNVYRLPDDLQPGIGQSIQFEWHVEIVGGASPESPVISGPGEVWTFTWGS